SGYEATPPLLGRRNSPNPRSKRTACPVEAIVDVIAGVVS
ncbi:MAG: hypothetical protein ACI8U4_000172, partial [Natronomonas sp.]